MPPRLRRILGLIGKESRQIVRDPSSMLIAGLLPLILLFLFGTGVSLDIRNIRIGLAIERPTVETASFAASLRDSRLFHARSPFPIRARWKSSWSPASSQAVVVLSGGFRAIASARGDTAPIQIIVDGSDPNTAALVQAYVSGVWQNWVQQEALTHPAAGPPGPTIVPVERFWFNPEVNSRNFLVPGIDRDRDDADRHAAHLAGGGARMGARHDGGAARDAGRPARFPDRQAGALFPSRHGLAGAVRGGVGLGFRRAVPRLGVVARVWSRRSFCWRRWGWGC